MINEIITIPNYIRTVKVSDKQRPIFWEWDNINIKAKNKRLLQKFIKPEFKNDDEIYQPHALRDEYKIGVFNQKYELLCTIFKNFQISNTDVVKKYLVRENIVKEKLMHKLKFLLYNEETNEIIVANENKVGKPKYVQIKGQDIYSGNVREHLRGLIMDAIKFSFIPYLKHLTQIKEYPVKIRVELHDTPINTFGQSDTIYQQWDLDNRMYPYMKAFPDLLVNGFPTKVPYHEKTFKPILLNDDVQHIQANSVEFIPIDDESKRKLVFYITSVTNKTVLEHEFYKNHKPNIINHTDKPY